MPRMLPPLRWFAAAVAALTVALASGCGSDAPSTSVPPITVGSKGFTESDVLASAYVEALRAEGFSASVRRAEGTAGAVAAVRAGRFDLYPEYTGTAWTVIRKRPPGGLEGRSPDEQLALVTRAIAGDAAWHRLAVAPATNNPVAACTPASGIRSYADLAGRARPARASGPSEAFTRPDGAPALARAYGFTLGEVIITKSDNIYGPVRQGRADCVAGNETDVEISELGLNVLADPKGVLDGAIDYRVFALASGPWWRGLGAEAQARVQGALERVSARITTAWVVDAIRRVRSDGAAPGAVAREILNVDVP